MCVCGGDHKLLVIYNGGVCVCVWGGGGGGGRVINF